MDAATPVTAPPSEEAILAELEQEADLSPTEPSPSDPAQTPAPDDAGLDPSAEPPEAAQASAGVSQPDAPASPDTPAPEVPEEPFAFTADAKRVAVEGATVKGDTITLSRSAWERQVQPHLADRAAFARQRQALEAQVTTKSVREQQSAQLIAQIQGVAGMDDEQVIGWALGLRERLPLMLKDAEIAALTAQQQPLQQLAAEQEAQVTEQQVGDWLQSSLHAYLATPEFQDLKGNTRFQQRVQTQLTRALGTLLSERRDAAGKPQLEAHWDRFHAILADEAADARQLATQAKRLAEIEAAAKANAQKVKAVPPTVATTGKPTGAVPDTTPATREAFEAELDALQSGRVSLI